MSNRVSGAVCLGAAGDAVWGVNLDFIGAVGGQFRPPLAPVGAAPRIRHRPGVESMAVETTAKRWAIPKTAAALDKGAA